MADLTLLWHGLLLTHDLLWKTAFCEDFMSFESVSNEGISIFLEINSIFIHSWLDQINLDLFFFSGFQLVQNLSYQLEDGMVIPDLIQLRFCIQMNLLHWKTRLLQNCRMELTPDLHYFSTMMISLYVVDCTKRNNV